MFKTFVISFTASIAFLLSKKAAEQLSVVSVVHSAWIHMCGQDFFFQFACQLLPWGCIALLAFQFAILPCLRISFAC